MLRCDRRTSNQDTDLHRDRAPASAFTFTIAVTIAKPVSVPVAYAVNTAATNTIDSSAPNPGGGSARTAYTARAAQRQPGRDASSGTQPGSLPGVHD